MATLDTATNLLKNRVDDGSYQLTTVATVLKLPWHNVSDASTDMPRSRLNWTPADFTRTTKYERRPVAVDAYVIAVGLEGAESTNCERPDSSWHDYHMWIVATEQEAHARDKSRAVVAEITPRVRHLHAGELDRKQIMQWAHDGTKVRVSGWLMLDPEHPSDARPDAAGHQASRGTIWEIHPVMKIGPAP
ncbi:MAG: hypothetical protein ACHQWU_07560 [Gemmatimonadales bacterium]